MTPQEIADAYDAAPLTTVNAQPAYALLRRYIIDRTWDAVRAGWVAVPTEDDALPNIAEALHTKRLPVYLGNLEHPEMDDVINFHFRFVHDLYGHGLITGKLTHDFSLAGEEAAANRQALDFVEWYSEKIVGPLPEITYDVLAAIHGEVYGQAAYFHARGAFPEPQKAFLLKRGQ